jgi:heterodisulfide reductase subunit C
MINFGYKIHKDRQIDFDSNSRRIIEFIRKRESSVDWCISCGTCASACTAAATTDYSLRHLIVLARSGEEETLINMANRCRFCGKCAISCPRGVNTRNIIYLMQLAVQKIAQHEI